MSAESAPPDSVSPDLARSYRSLRRLARVAAGLIVLSAVVGTFDMIVRGSAYIATGVLLAAPDWLPLQHVYPRVNAWGLGPLAKIERVLVTVRSVWFGIMLAAGLAFLLWLSGAVANLRALGVPRICIHPAWAVVSLLALVPALFTADAILDDQVVQKVAPAIVIACLAAPLVVMRRLWIASSSSAADLSSSTDQPAASWAVILAWWVAFTVFWVSWQLALATFEGSEVDAYTPVETALRVLAMGSFEFVAGVAWATAAVFAVRIILRVTSMQDAAAQALPEPPPEPVNSGSVRPPAGEDATTVASDAVTDIPRPSRRRAAQWHCVTCEVMNSTAIRFCQNCASERR